MKRGQINLSFGMIFSIILIIIFISFAFYGIKLFLDSSTETRLYQFREDLQNDVNRVWRSDYSSSVKEYLIPSKVNEVCFIDLISSSRGERKKEYDDLISYGERMENNLVFIPVGRFGSANSFQINNIDLIKLTEYQNPFCIKSNKGRLKILIKKEVGDSLVSLERV